MFQWTSHGEPGDRNYLELPKKLVSLAQTGVKINILFTAGQVDASVQNYLEDRPNIDVHDTTRGTDANGNALHYTHNKYMMVERRICGRDQRQDRVRRLLELDEQRHLAQRRVGPEAAPASPATTQVHGDDWQNQYSRCAVGPVARQLSAEERCREHGARDSDRSEADPVLGVTGPHPPPVAC
ncbi:hypothetical protein [Streptomyces sp. KL116D]|uniref:hypothetical protein n=1 Tax=Streptomyces sp. KL116D TaxID=3045152 RepID=UPI0035579237